MMKLNRAPCEWAWRLADGESFDEALPRAVVIAGELPSPVSAAPARYEPFGLSILEAAGDRCALMLGDIPSLREIWDSRAQSVAPGDHEALLAALATLLSRPERARELTPAAVPA
jgi:hypothetical protein